MFAAISKWLEPWYNKYAVMALAAAIGVGAYEWIGWSCLTASDWGTWVGAIGTVGALFGTLWVSTAQERKEITQARLHAAGFTLRVVNARGAVSRVCRSLSIDARIDRGAVKITERLYDLDKIDLWTMADLVPMTPLSPRAIGQLAEARDQIATAIKALELAREDDTLKSTAGRVEFAKRLHYLLSGTANLLDDGIQVCDGARRALHMHSE